MADLMSIIASNYVTVGANVNLSKTPYVPVDAPSFEGSWDGKYANNDKFTIQVSNVIGWRRTSCSSAFAKVTRRYRPPMPSRHFWSALQPLRLGWTRMPLQLFVTLLVCLRSFSALADLIVAGNRANLLANCRCSRQQ